MAEMHFLQDLLVLFGLGIVTVVAFHRLNLPPVLGFLVTGVICGPYGFKLVEDGKSIEALAEIGLVLLLFTIGIEFSISTFLKLKRFLLIAGGLQILLTVAASATLAKLFGMSWNSAVFIGMLVSLSSTAIVVRILEYRGDFDSAHGRSALGILIFQDLCIVPMVLVTPFLSGKGGNIWDVAILTGKALLFLAAVAAVARYLVPTLLNQVAITKKREAFVLSIILLCLGTATATSKFGLSMALGAFVAGLIISESKFSHQALGEVVPFREVFNCLVFVSIGMLFDLRVLLLHPFEVISILILVIFVKTLVGTAVTVFAGHSIRVGLLTGFALAQISEFSFVLSKVGLNTNVLDNNSNQLFLAVAILSMFLTPACINLGTLVANWLEERMPKISKLFKQESEIASLKKLDDHVIVVGYSQAGRNIVAALVHAGISYTVVEQDPQIVKTEKAKGLPITYGDPARAEILHHLGINEARLIVLTNANLNTSLACVDLVKRLNPTCRILARARSMEELNKLEGIGAHDVIPEELAASLELQARIFADYGLNAEATKKSALRVCSEHDRAKNEELDQK